jgi:hypothetical protein
MRSRQRGQSLVEMAISCIALVPLFVGVWFLGKYIHLRQQTQAFARSAAWNATVSPTIVTSAMVRMQSPITNRGNLPAP